ncbi:ABC transporter [Ophiocordyceps sinensis CO18]|uniref:ABC transporter n=1 Tax=Ophiocordyceps sinensis (strain Co18 / CGMCC 3.14243) TaxID=911162 RepID=T5A4H0_OPHSC|nr:ABC transporter [Ophiocordyceps sinensis CO18]
MQNATACDDASFGPTINGCRGNFDFTLLFEQSFFSILLPWASLLSAARLSILLSRRTRQVSGTRFQLGKLAAIACYGAVQAALLVFWARTGVYGSRTSLAAAVLSFVDVFALAALSWFEHGYSPRPSTLINIHLLLSVLFDAVQARTLWLKDSGNALPALFTASLGIKIGLFALESLEKDSFLPPRWRDRSPEDKSGVFSRGPVCPRFRPRDSASV